MDWNETLQTIIDEVEQHLQRKEEPINREEIAKIAGCSFHFFQKVFSYMNGISFADYVRARKMTLAGYDLKSTSMKVIEIAYKYGYDSPTSFTKAFQQFHGVTPTEARKQDQKLNIFPKMQIATQQRYVWKLRQMPALRLLGKAISISSNVQIKQKQILQFWSDIQRDGTFLELIQLDHGKPQGMFGLFGSMGCDRSDQYSIMVISDEPFPYGYQEFILPEMTWAIFDCYGPIPTTIQSCWKYLTQEWLMQYPFAHANCPELEWYSSGNLYASDYHSQIWIPIIDPEEK